MTLSTVTVFLCLFTEIYEQTQKTCGCEVYSKKIKLEVNSLKKYRPVSNIHYLSKILEKVDRVIQDLEYLTANELFEVFQSDLPTITQH